MTCGAASSARRVFPGIDTAGDRSVAFGWPELTPRVTEVSPSAGRAGNTARTAQLRRAVKSETGVSLDCRGDPGRRSGIPLGHDLARTPKMIGRRVHVTHRTPPCVTSGDASDPPARPPHAIERDRVGGGQDPPHNALPTSRRTCSRESVRVVGIRPHGTRTAFPGIIAPIVPGTAPVVPGTNGTNGTPRLPCGVPCGQTRKAAAARPWQYKDKSPRCPSSAATSPGTARQPEMEART